MSPVTEPAATARPVYCPRGRVRLLDGAAAIEGGRTIDAPAPYESMPLHVRAGSIVPSGPRSSGRASAGRPDPARRHTGRDGRFTLHEDDGETNAHETGAFSTIPIAWSEADGTLTIGERSG